VKIGLFGLYDEMCFSVL